jgi:hypothetical protein
MLEIIAKFGSPDGIKKIWRSTFEGRRYEITRKRTKTDLPLYTLDILKQCCPLLNQSYFVS